MKRFKNLLLLTTFIPLLTANAAVTNGTVVNVNDLDSLEKCLQTTNNICTLSTDIPITRKIQIQNVDVEINLNNHNINYDENLALDPLFNVRNASVDVTGKGTITNNKRTFYLDGNTTVGNDPIKAELTIGKDVTMISTEFVNVFLRGAGSKLDVYGTLITHSGNHAVIQGNGTIDTKQDMGNTEITIYDGALIKSTSNGGAIYHPQNGLLTIYGGKIESETTAIEMRAGNLVVKGGEIISHDEETTYKKNDSGATINGAGIAISQHLTKQKISFEMSAGTVKGPVAVYKLASVDPAKESDITLNISGGKFISTNNTDSIIVENTTEFISGGEFTENLAADAVKSTYLVKGIETAYKQSTNTYTYGTKYTITINQPKNGTIKANKSEAIAGEEIELTFTPNEGYKLSNAGVIYNNGASDFIIKNNTFEMPNSNVIIEAAFEVNTSNPPTGDNILVSIVVLVISTLSILIIRNKVKAY